MGFQYDPESMAFDGADEYGEDVADLDAALAALFQSLTPKSPADAIIAGGDPHGNPFTEERERYLRSLPLDEMFYTVAAEDKRAVYLSAPMATIVHEAIATLGMVAQSAGPEAAAAAIGFALPPEVILLGLRLIDEAIHDASESGR